MREKRYTYSVLNNGQYGVSDTTFTEIYDQETTFSNRICNVNSKKQAQKIVDLLNSKDKIIYNLNETLSKTLPMWVIEKVINRRIQSTTDENVRKELKELLEELK